MTENCVDVLTSNCVETLTNTMLAFDLELCLQVLVPEIPVSNCYLTEEEYHHDWFSLEIFCNFRCSRISNCRAFCIKGKYSVNFLQPRWVEHWPQRSWRHQNGWCTVTMWLTWEYLIYRIYNNILENFFYKITKQILQSHSDIAFYSI